MIFYKNQKYFTKNKKQYFTKLKRHLANKSEKMKISMILSHYKRGERNDR